MAEAKWAEAKKPNEPENVREHVSGKKISKTSKPSSANDKKPFLA